MDQEPPEQTIPLFDQITGLSSIGIPDGYYPNSKGKRDILFTDMGISIIHEETITIGGKIVKSYELDYTKDLYFENQSRAFHFANGQIVLMTEELYTILLGTENFIENPTAETVTEWYNTAGNNLQKKKTQ